jgi:hypothetical protein
MKKIKNYLLSTIIAFAPSLLWAHPGHEHHGTVFELFGHYLVTLVLIIGLGAGLFGLGSHFLSKRKTRKFNN